MSSRHPALAESEGPLAALEILGCPSESESSGGIVGKGCT
jgi:hypothetical protein